MNDATRPMTARSARLLSDKCWAVLGMTGMEFIDAYAEGSFDGDQPPEVQQLITLLETGEWS